MEGFLTQGWDLLVPWCAGTSMLSRGETLPARWLYEPQPTRNQRELMIMTT